MPVITLEARLAARVTVQPGLWGLGSWQGVLALPDVPYQESVDYLWTEKAFGMLESGALHGEVVSRDGVIRSRVWGPCPRCQECGHEIDDRQTLTAVTNLMGGEWRSVNVVTARVVARRLARSSSRWMCHVAAGRHIGRAGGLDWVRSEFPGGTAPAAGRHWQAGVTAGPPPRRPNASQRPE